MGLWTPPKRSIIKPPLKVLGVRQPAKARVTARLHARCHYRLLHRSGAVRAEGEAENIVTDAGLDQVAAYALLGYTYGVIDEFPIMAYFAVGTGNTTPAATDTTLDAEIARINDTYDTLTVVRTSAGVYELTNYFEVGYADGIGNLQEWAVSPIATADGTIFDRSLFSAPITKTSDDKLQAAVTLTITLTPTTATAGSFDIANAATARGSGSDTIAAHYLLIGGADGSDERTAWPDLSLFSSFAQGITGTTASASPIPAIGCLEARSSDQSAVTYVTDITSRTIGNLATIEDTPWDAYTPGSLTRTSGAMKFDTDEAAGITIEAIQIWGNSHANASFSRAYRVGYMCDFDAGSAFPKNAATPNGQSLTIGLPEPSWSR